MTLGQGIASASSLALRLAEPEFVMTVTAAVFRSLAYRPTCWILTSNVTKKTRTRYFSAVHKDENTVSPAPFGGGHSIVATAGL